MTTRLRRARGVLRSGVLTLGGIGLLTLLAGCGGGGGGDDPPPPPPPPPPIQTRDVSGEAIKGTVRNGRVAVFAVSAGAVGTTAIATGTTDDTGRFVLQVPTDRTGPAVIEITSAPTGSTPATTMLCDHPAGCRSGSGEQVDFGAPITLAAGFRLRVAVPDIAAASTASVSLFTDLAAAQAIAAGNLDAARIRNANDAVRDLFDLDEDITRIDNTDLSVQRDISTLSEPRRRAALLSAGAMAALLEATDGAPGAALGTALDRLRDRFTREGGQLIANDGDIDSAGVSLSDILDATVAVGDSSAVTVGSLTELRAEAMRVAQVPAGQRTDGSPSPNFGASERAVALAFINDLRDVSDVFGDADLADEVLPDAIRDAVELAVDDTAEAGEVLGFLATAVVDAIVRHRDGEAGPIDSDGVTVDVRSEANGATTFSAEYEEDDIDVTLRGTTTGEFEDLEADDDGRESTSFTLDVTASLSAPGVRGEVSRGQIRVAYARTATAAAFSEIVAESDAVLSDFTRDFDVRDDRVVIASVELDLVLRLQQTAAQGIDALTLDVNLALAGTNLTRDNVDTVVAAACPPPVGNQVQLVACGTTTLRESKAFDALAVELGATVTSASGRSYRIGIAAEFDGMGVEFVDREDVLAGAIVTTSNISIARQLFGDGAAARGNRFCCFPIAGLAGFENLERDTGLAETDDAFIAGEVALEIETNVAPLDPRTLLTLRVVRDGRRTAHAELGLEYGDRELALTAEYDDSDEGDGLVALTARNGDGARFTGEYDPDERIATGELSVNTRRQARLEDRVGVAVFLFEDGALESLN